MEMMKKLSKARKIFFNKRDKLESLDETWYAYREYIEKERKLMAKYPDYQKKVMELFFE